MDPYIAYAVIGLVGLAEGGEFSALVASFVMRLAELPILPVATTLTASIFISDLLWYRLGHTLYDLPFIRKVIPLLEPLDRRIRERPYMVALVARFSYGIHHATIARYRQNGIGPFRMLGISIGTFIPWAVLVGAVVAGLQLLAPEVGRAFRAVEYVVTLGFILFFLLELGVSARVRHMPGILREAYEFVSLLIARFVGYITYAYGALLSILFVLIVSTPFLVHGGTLLLTEEMLEMCTLLALAAVGMVVYRSYRKRLLDAEYTVTDMSRHIGALNLQTVQVDAMLKKFTRLPENKHDLTQFLSGLNANILAAIDAPWVLTRVVDVRTGRTLTEQFSARGSEDIDHAPTVSNRALLGETRPRGFYIYRSSHRNSHIRVACAMPQRSLNQHQEVVLRAAVNNLALVYMVFVAQSGEVAISPQHEPASPDNNDE